MDLTSQEVLTDDNNYTNLMKTHYIADIHHSEFLKNYGFKGISNESNIYNESTISATSSERAKVKPKYWTTPSINIEHLYSNRRYTKSHNYRSPEREYKYLIPNKPRETNTFTNTKDHTNKNYVKGQRKSCSLRRKRDYENNVYEKSTEEPEQDKYFEQKTRGWDVKNIAGGKKKKNGPVLQNNSQIFTHQESNNHEGENINTRQHLSVETMLETEEKDQMLKFKNNIIEVKGSDTIYLPVILLDKDKSDFERICRDIHNQKVNVQALAAPNLQNENNSFKISENIYNQRKQITTHLDTVVGQKTKNTIEPEHRPETSWANGDSFSKSIRKNTPEKDKMNQRDACKTNKDPFNVKIDINLVSTTKEELCSIKSKDASFVKSKIGIRGIEATFNNCYPVTKDYIKVNNINLGNGKAIIMRPRKTHEEKQKSNNKKPNKGFLTNYKKISQNTTYKKLISRKRFIRKCSTENIFSERHGPERNMFNIERKQGSTVIENNLQQEIVLKVKSISGRINLSAFNEDTMQKSRKTKNKLTELNASNTENSEERNRIVPKKEVVLDKKIETSNGSVTINRQSNIFQKILQANLLRARSQKSKSSMKMMHKQQQKAKLIFKNWKLTQASSDQHYIQTKTIEQNKMTTVYEGRGEASSQTLGQVIKNEFMIDDKMLVLPKERKSNITGEKAEKEVSSEAVIKNSVIKENVHKTDLENERNLLRQQIARQSTSEIFYNNCTQIKESDKELSLLSTQEQSNKLDTKLSKLHICDNMVYRNTLSIPSLKEIGKKVSSEIAIKDSIITENIHITEALENESLQKKCTKEKIEAEITWDKSNVILRKNGMNLQSAIFEKECNKHSTKNMLLKVEEDVNMSYKERILTVKWKKKLKNVPSEIVIQESDSIKHTQVSEIDKNESLLKQHIENQDVTVFTQDNCRKSKSDIYLSSPVLKKQSNKSSSTNNKNMLDLQKAVDITYQERMVTPMSKQTDSDLLNDVTIKCSVVTENIQKNELERKQSLVSQGISRQTVVEPIQHNRESRVDVDLSFSDLGNQNKRDSDRSDKSPLKMQEVDTPHKNNDAGDLGLGTHSSYNKDKIKTFAADTTNVKILELEQNSIYKNKPKCQIPFIEFALINIEENKSISTKSHAPENIHISSNILSNVGITKVQKNNHSLFIQRVDPISTIYKNQQQKNKLITMYKDNEKKVEAKHSKLSMKFFLSKLEITPPNKSRSRLFKPLSRNKTKLGKHKLIKETYYDHTKMYMHKYQRNVWGHCGQLDSQNDVDEGVRNVQLRAQISTKITDKGKQLSRPYKYRDENKIEKRAEINKTEQFTEGNKQEHLTNKNVDQLKENDQSCQCLCKTVKQAKEYSNFFLGTTLYQQLKQLQDLR